MKFYRNIVSKISTLTNTLILLTLLTLILLLVQLILPAIAEAITPAINKYTLLDGVKKTELSEEQFRDNRINSAEKLYKPDGTIHLLQTDLLAGTKTKTITFTDLKLNEISKNQQNNYLCWPTLMQNLRDHKLNIANHERRIDINQPNSARSIVVPVVDRSGKKVLQRWKYDGAKHIFTGYDNSTEIIGYLGKNGFTTDKKSVEGFVRSGVALAWKDEGSYIISMLWQTNKALYEFNFEDKGFNVLFSQDDSNIDSVSIGKWKKLTSYKTKREIEPEHDFIIIKTHKIKPVNSRIIRQCHVITNNPFKIDQINAVSSDQIPTSRITLHNDEIYIRDRNNLTLSKDRSQWPEDWPNKPITYNNIFHKINTDGSKKILNEFQSIRHPNTLVIKRELNETPFGYRNGHLGNEVKLTSQYFTAICPLAFRVAIDFIDIKYREGIYRLPSWVYNARIAGIFAAPWSYPLGLISSVIMTLLCLRYGWSRKTNWFSFGIWLAFVFVFNVIGLLTYLALNHSKTIVCSSCDKKRTLAQANCIHCGAELDRPTGKETDLILI